jgi:cytochrome c oxidase cbb3-type subunit III
MSAPRDEDRLLDHKYDDIQEYDNPLPGWWTLILWGTIVWAVLYFFNFIPGVGTGKGRIANFERDSTAAAEKYGSVQQQASAAIDVNAMMAALQDPAELAAGKAIFEDPSKCSSCHLVDGGGVVGPNLTDDYWIHGPRPIDILTTITNGVPDKGMLTWGPILGPKKIAQVAAYVYSLHGTHPATPKEPQGTKYTYDANGPVMTAPADSAAAK